MAKKIPSNLQSVFNSASLVKETRKLLKSSPLSKTFPDKQDSLISYIRQILTEVGDQPIYDSLAYLDNEADDDTFDYLIEAVDRASSTLVARFASKDDEPTRGIFTLGLIPLNVNFMMGAVPFESLKSFILDQFDPAQLFDKMVQVGICDSSSIFGFLPQFLERTNWPNTWHDQLLKLREVFEIEMNNRKEGEFLSDFTVYSEQEPTTYIHTKGLVLPFIYLQREDEPEPLLAQMLSASSAGIPLSEECSEAWAQVASALEEQFTRTSGIMSVQVLTPGFQMPALENQQDLLNELNLKESIFLLRQKAKQGAPFHAFGEAYETDSGVEWRIVMRMGKFRAQTTWQVVASFDETEEAILDAFHEQGIFQNQITFNDELHTISEISICPVCEAPLFIDPMDKELTCGHPIPDSRHVH